MFPRAGAKGLKRTVDLVLGTLLAVGALPAVLLLMAPVAASLRAHPLFVHWRVGADGRRIPIVKLRTLPPSTPRYVDKYRLRGIETTRLCRVLRSLHLDELPQLLLVPLGVMSLVGPRPEMRFLHDRMDPAFALTRTSVRPGVTGLWQVSVASRGLLHEAPQYDLFYLSHRTLRFDLWILWRSVLKALRIGRPITLDHVPEWVLSRDPDQRAHVPTPPVPAGPRANTEAGDHVSASSVMSRMDGQ